jgi:hypothetical protein
MTRMIQVHVHASVWKFESSLRHQFSLISKSSQSAVMVAVVPLTSVQSAADAELEKDGIPPSIKKTRW